MRANRLIVLALGLLLHTGAMAGPNQCVFNQPGTAAWENSAHWNGCGGNFPGSADRAIITNGGTAVTTTAITVFELEIAGTSTVRVGNTLTVQNQFDWFGGTLESSSPGIHVVLEPNTSTNVFIDNGPTLRSARLVNQGTITLPSTGPGNPAALFLDGNALIDNQGVFRFENNSGRERRLGCRTGIDCGAFENQAGGVVELDVPNADSLITVSGLTYFDNDGLVHHIGAGHAVIDAAGDDQSGTYRAQSTRDLILTVPLSRQRVFNDITHESIGGARTVLEGAGRFVITGGTTTLTNLTINGETTVTGDTDIEFAGTTVFKGTLDSIGPGPIPSAEVLSGSLMFLAVNHLLEAPTLGRRILYINGALNNSYNDPGTNQPDVGLKFGTDGQLFINGSASLRAGRAGEGFSCQGGPPPCGRIEVQAGGNLVLSGGGGAPFVVDSSLIELANAGSLEVLQGQVVLDATYLDLAGDVRVSQTGVLTRNVGALALSSGLLRGSGVLDCNIDCSSDCRVMPEGSGQVLTINGDFTDGSGSGSALFFELTGSEPASYSRLLIRGNASFLRNLEAGPQSPYSPLATDQFSLIEVGGSISGLPDLQNPGDFPPTFDTEQRGRFIVVRNIVAISRDCLWTGALSSQWNLPSNWTTCGGTFPGATDSATLTSGALNYPIIPASTTFQVGDLVLNGNASISGASSSRLTVLKRLDFEVATINGMTLELASGGTGAFYGGPKTFDGANFFNFGQTQWSGGLINLSNGSTILIGDASRFIANVAAITEGILSTDSATNTVDIEGRFQKIGPGEVILGQLTANRILVNASASGTVDVTQGLLDMRGSGTWNSGISLAAGGDLLFTDGPVEFDSASVIAGGGQLFFGPSTSPINSGPYDFRGTWEFDGATEIRYADLRFDPSVTNPITDLSLTAPSSLFRTFVSVDIDRLIWFGGTLIGGIPGQTITTNEANVGDLSAPVFPRRLENLELFLNGFSYVYDDEPLTMAQDARLSNNSFLYFRPLGPVPLCEIIGEVGTPSQIVNTGLWQNDFCSLLQVSGNLSFSNQNRVFATSSAAIELNAPGADDGLYTAFGPRALRFSADRGLSPSTFFDGDKGPTITAGTTTIGNDAPLPSLDIDGGVVDFVAPSGQMTVNALDLDGGILQGAFNSITVIDDFNWTGGEIAPGQQLNLQTPATASFSGPTTKVLHSSDLFLEGSTNWSGGPIEFRGASAIEVQGRFDVTAGSINPAAATCSTCSGSNIDILGSGGELHKLGSGTFAIADGIDLNATGQIHVEQGGIEVLSSNFQPNSALELGGVGTFFGKASGSVDFSTSQLLGTGRVDGSVFVIETEISPGVAPSGIGQIEFSEDVFVNNQTVLNFDILGEFAGQFDQVIASQLRTDNAVVSFFNPLSISLPTSADIEVISTTTGITSSVLEGARSGFLIEGSNAFSGDGFALAQEPLSAFLRGPGGVDYVVDTIADSSGGLCTSAPDDCSLRDAITLANADAPAPRIIGFGIPGPGWHTISLTSCLPPISGVVTIDGYTQPGSAPNTAPKGSPLNTQIQIEISPQTPAPLTDCADGLNAQGSVLVRGLSITGFSDTGAGILVNGGGAEVYGNFLGVRPDGTARGNTYGVHVTGGSTVFAQIGSINDLDRNLIGSNTSGIQVANLPTGGKASIAIEGNVIGLAPSLASVVPNGSGISIDGVVDVASLEIGSSGSGNIIAGNVADGIFVATSTSVPVRIYGNQIGFEAPGPGLIGNGGHGVHVLDGGGPVRIGSQDGKDLDQSNLIQFNEGHGILIGTYVSTPVGNGPVGVGINRWIANGLLPVKLFAGPSGTERLANDAGDSDTGANNLQNFPVISGWTEVSGPSLNIDYIVESTSFPVRVDFYFAEPFYGQSDEPTQYVGSADVLAAGPQFINVGDYAGFGPDTVVVGIARDSLGNSSEVSFYGDSSTISVSTDPASTTSGSPYDADVSFDPVELGLNPTVPVEVIDGQLGCTIGALGGFNPATGSCLLVTTGSGVIDVFARIDPFRTPYGDVATGEALSAQTTHTIVPAGAATCTWDGSVGSWDDPSRWIGCAGGTGAVPGTPGTVDTAIVGSGTVTLPANRGVGVLQQTGGTIDGGGGFDLVVLNALTFSGGVQRGGGTTFVAAGATADLSSMGSWTLDGRTFDIDGSTTWNGGTALLEDTGALLFDGPIFTSLGVGAGNLIISCATPPCANNRMVLFGSTTWIIAGGAFNVFITGLSEFQNRGTITVSDGMLLDIFAPGGAPEPGNYNLGGANAAVRFSGDRQFSNMNAQRPPGPGTSFSGVGTVEFVDGVFVFDLNTISLAFNDPASSFEIQSAATVDFDGSTTVDLPALTVRGELRGTATTITAGPGCFIDGATVEGPAATELNCGTVSTLIGALNTFSGRSLRITSNADWLGGDLDFNSDAALLIDGFLSANVPSRAIVCTTAPCAPDPVQLSTGSALQVINTGFTVTTGGISTTDAEVSIGAGAAVQATRYLQQGSTALLELNGVNAELSASPVQIIAGRLAGVGRLDGAVSVQGTVQPGFPGQVGLLEITGDLLLGSSASVEMELQSAAAFDRITVSDEVSFGSPGASLTISGLAGYVPTVADNFSLFQFATNPSNSTFGSVANPFLTHEFVYTATSADLNGIVVAGDVTIADASISEGDSGFQVINFTVSISAPPSADVSFNWATEPGTAFAPGDYQTASGSLTFTPTGPTSLQIAVSVVGDTVFELDETFGVRLSNLTGPGVLADDFATGTIVNDDATPVLVIEDASFVEGTSGGFTNAFFVVRRTGATDLGTQVSFATADGDGVGAPAALASSDYVARTTTVNFGATETVKFVAIQLVADSDLEPSEAFFGRLSGATNATISDAEGVMTILNDDGQAFTMATGCGLGVEESAAIARVEVNRSAAKQAGSVRYSTLRISALEGLDYTPVSGILSWPAGDDTPRFIEVPILEDSLVEPTKSFLVTLSIPSAGYAIGTPGETLVEIFDNDDRIFGNGGDPARCLGD